MSFRGLVLKLHVYAGLLSFAQLFVYSTTSTPSR